VNWEMGAVQSRRIIVGVNGSLASLRALRAAVAEARRRDARLTVIYVRPPAHASASIGVLGIPDPTPWPGQQTVQSLDREAEALIARCIDEGLGNMPADVTVAIRVEVGTPHTALVQQVWRDDDLLVVGTRGRSRCARPWHHSVGRYCVAHARCPVLVVPPDDFARATWRERRWYRSRLHGDPWKGFDAQAPGTGQCVRDA
jgi:nucleotide-binding universal stress UspA family protein